MLVRFIRMGMSQREFATLGGVTMGSQCGYEAGALAPRARYLRKIIQGGGADFDYLFGNSSHSNPGKQTLRNSLPYLELAK